MLIRAYRLWFWDARRWDAFFGKVGRDRFWSLLYWAEPKFWNPKNVRRNKIGAIVTLAFVLAIIFFFLKIFAL